MLEVATGGEQNLKLHDLKSGLVRSCEQRNAYPYRRGYSSLSWFEHLIYSYRITWMLSKLEFKGYVQTSTD